ncbi:RNA polymerase sigma factor [Calycomorphotria hydatis]|uniref:RNA polymerase sigma factor n=1 Tax=Calycomorphotria hydatis TaxID=2528027 RepID=UPI0011A84FCE|nr:sigma-70 family RNA polymerase sigma factor [Calycomorphotria hydatis]
MALTEIDRGLLDRCLAQRQGAWRDFVDRFLGLFLHVVNHSAHLRSVPLRPDQAEDICAEIMLEIIKDDFAVLRRFERKSSLATYLVVIARRVVVRELENQRKSEALGHVRAASVKHVAHVETFEKRIEDKDEVARLLEGLTMEEAEIVRRYHIRGQSYRDISRELGIAENSVGPILSRARTRLRERAVGT